MNLNDVAVDVTRAEGKKISISIAQVKEVMGHLLRRFAKESDSEILKTVHRYRARKVKKPRRRCPGW